MSNLSMKNNNTIKWISKVLGKKKLYIALLTVLEGINGASGVLYALLFKNIVDCAAAQNSSGFWNYAFYTICLVAAQIAVRALLRWLNELTCADYENIFKERLMHCLMCMDYSDVSAVHSGEWLNRLTNDTNVIAGNCASIIPGISGMTIKLISALIMLIALDRRFAAIALPVGGALLLLTYTFRKTLKKLHKQVQEADGRLCIFLQENIGSMLIVRAFSAENQTESDALQKMKDHKSARMKRNYFSNICNIGFAVAMNGMYLFGICYCGYGMLKGTLSFGTLTAVTQLIAQIQTPFANLTGFLPKYYAMTASAERLMEAEKFTRECVPALSADKISDLYNNSFISLGLDNARFTYFPPADPHTFVTHDKSNMPIVLDALSLEIHKGEYVAFTGHSGCGKSTVLKLLMSIYDLDSGRRFIKCSDGVRELNAGFSGLFAYVPQGNHLMNGTIREVVSFAYRQHAYDEQRLQQALKIACADDFVYELEEGVDTVLGERGAGLSEGQTQRIAIARALFSQRPILLLDEATSALDEQTELRLLRNLRCMTDKTVIIVTHRPAALSICDRKIDFSLINKKSAD